MLLTDDLNALGASAITRDERQQAFERLQVPPAAVADRRDGDPDRPAGRRRAGRGRIAAASKTTTLVVRARSIALDTGRVHGRCHRARTAAGSVRHLRAHRAAHGAAVARRRPRMSSGSIRRSRRSRASSKACSPKRRRPRSTICSAALQPDSPTFDRARLALWDVYADQGDHARALAAVDAGAGDSPWSRRARFLAGLSQLNLKKYDDAFATFKALADAQPTPAVLNNLGVVQLRRGGTPQTGSPTYFFNKAAEADPDDPDYFFNLGYAYWHRPRYAGGDLLAARSGAAQSRRRRRPLRARRRARRRRATPPRRRASASWRGGCRRRYEPGKRPGGRAVPKGLERVKTTSSCRTRARSTRGWRRSEQREQRGAGAVLPRSRAAAVPAGKRSRGDRRAESRAVSSRRTCAEAHLLLGRIHLRNGRVREAIDAFKISLWSAETAEAHAALGEAYRQAKDLDRGARRGRARARARSRIGRGQAAARRRHRRRAERRAKITLVVASADPGRRLPRNPAEREAAGVPVHGRDGRVGRDLPVRRARRPRRPRRARRVADSTRRSTTVARNRRRRSRRRRRPHRRRRLGSDGGRAAAAPPTISATSIVSKSRIRRPSN